jgi:hypothetical protein
LQRLDLRPRNEVRRPRTGFGKIGYSASLFENVGFDKIFRIHETLDFALRAAAPSTPSLTVMPFEMVAAGNCQ